MKDLLFGWLFKNQFQLIGLESMIASIYRSGCYYFYYTWNYRINKIHNKQNKGRINK